MSNNSIRSHNQTVDINPFTISMKDVLNKVYSINIENYKKPELYFFDNHKTANENDINRFIKLAKPLGYDTDNKPQEELQHITQIAMNNRFETTYIKDSLQEIHTIMSKIIVSDFKKLNDHVKFEHIESRRLDDENIRKRQKVIMNSSFDIRYHSESKLFIFSGSIEKLAYSIIAISNERRGYYTSDINDWCNENNEIIISPDKIRKNINKNLDQLNNWQSLFDSYVYVYNSNSLTSKLLVNDKGEFGNYNFKEPDVVHAMNIIDGN